MQITFEKKSLKKSKIMFQICVSDQKVQGKKKRYILETFFKCND
jgi:hypothetical protein